MGVIRSNDPNTWTDVDGIILNEVAPASNVARVAANVGILVGQSQRGPAELTELVSLTMAQEVFGKDKTKGLNKVLKNKTFGRLKFIRVVASDAVLATKNFASSAVDRIKFDAKGGKGLFGNSIQVAIEEASQSRQEKHTVLCVADVADNLDQKYFILRDEVGTVGVWLDVDDGGGSAPAGALACNRQIEVTTIVTNDSAATVASKIAAVLEADSKFSASADGATITATCVAYAPGVGTVGNGDSGFTVTRTLLGANEGKKYSIKDVSADAVLPIEVYDNIKIANIANDLPFIKSKLVVPTVLSSLAEPANTAYTALAGGADGTVSDSDYEDAIEKAKVDGAGNVLFLDAYNAVRNGYLKLHAAEAQNKMVIVEGLSSDEYDDAITGVDNLRDTDGRIIYAFNPAITVIDGIEVEQPAAWWIAAAYTQCPAHIDLAFVENVKFMAGITRLKYSLGTAEFKLLNKAGICSLEFDADFGHKVKSAVTTQVINTEKQTILRRRMTDFLQDSLAKYLKNFANGVNSKRKRDSVKAGIMRFDDALINDEILPGDAEVSGGSARLIDTESQNTDDSIGQGMFKVVYKRRIYSSMRYIVLSTEIGTGVVVVEEVA